MMFDLAQIQQALREFSFDGWLLYDFRGSNVLAQRVLGIAPEAVGSRRYAYCIPAAGAPRKLVHRIEPGALDHLPGEKNIYLRWREFEEGIAKLAQGMQTLAMEYSPRNANPYVSRVDAGTIEIVRGAGAEIVSSGDLVQLFEATWSPEQWQLYLEAARHTDLAYAVAWKYIAEAARKGNTVEELEVRRQVMDHFAAHNMTTYHPPIVAVGPHSGDPHYETGTGRETKIGKGSFVLIDLWAKLDAPQAVYSDLTRVGYVGEQVPAEYVKIFNIVAAARDAAIEFVEAAFRAGRVIQGWQVDQAARDVIEQAGYGKYFVHRTGHSIGQETHGNGANMDNLETREERRVMRSTCFSIEPGIYLPEFGIRSEVNLFVDVDGKVHVTGGDRQTEVLPILREF